MGDFDLIYRAADKNNRNLNLRPMRSFRRTLNSRELKEIHLQNRRFTWSNERRSPTLARLDRFFCNQGWDLTFVDHALHALSSHSDHCPLLVSPLVRPTATDSLQIPKLLDQTPGLSNGGAIGLDANNKPH